MCVDSVSGNIALEKWSATSIRRAGVCADHFSEDCFKGQSKKSLKRGSVPLPFRNIASSKESSKNIDMEIMSIAVTENTMNVTIANEKCQNAIRSITLESIENDENDEMMNQSFQRPSSRTYQLPQLQFNQISEEEDVMEWIQFEPPICEKISAQTITKEQEKEIEKINNTDKRNEEKDFQIIIDSLKNENLRLRRTIKITFTKIHSTNTCKT